MSFAQPLWLLLLATCPLPLALERARPRLAWPTLGGFPAPRRGRSWRARLRWLAPLALALALAATAVALARPRTVGGRIRVASRGVVIVAAIDRSSSMKADDFPADRGTRRVSRLEAALATFSRFVEGRPDDLIGLVAFANFPDLACVPTLDHARLAEAAAAVRPARAGDDGTNIGDAIAAGLDALRREGSPRKVLVLLTDGNDEPAGPHLDPVEAAGLARDLGVTLHTVAVGRPGRPRVVHGRDPATGLPVAAEIGGPDLELLARLAAIAGGRSFLAADSDGLDGVFAAIDALAKSPLEARILTRYDEHYRPFAALALALLGLHQLLTLLGLRPLP